MLPVQHPDMSRRANAAARCPRCRLHGSLCICALIVPIATRTRLLLITHRSEDRKSTNTGRLATLCLTNSEVIVRGNESNPTPPFQPDPSSDAVFLFPFEGAVPLTEYAGSSRSITLIVPDGTWRQASKVRNRVGGLREIPCVSLPPGLPSTYRLRFEAHAHGLATIEAIARAMGVLEGQAARASVELAFRAMVERTLWSRGEIATEDVTSGIPAGAMRHDPRSGLARTGRPPLSCRRSPS